MDSIPTWNGDTNIIVQWINEINDIAKFSSEIRCLLGSMVPQRLVGSTKTWYYSLPRKDRNELEQDWKKLREAIAEYYMNWKWAETM